MSDRSGIAIVGVACRFPGASSPEAFWKLLREGREAVTDTPADRFGNGAISDVRRGGFLDDVEGFDEGFFGVSPNEVAALDPQQRMLLELTWEALEDAGITGDGARREDAGVFVGVMSSDYAERQQRDGPEAITRYTLTGGQRAMIANRVSYALGLRGPSLTVDTAQSSALVAVHLACQSLRAGETTLALAGGINLNLSLSRAVAAARLGALSPDGRCFVFDARANGFVPGEGGGVVVLKPLSRALADADPVYCVIRGSAVNNDGGGETLAAPDRRGQEDVLRRAYRQARVDPGDVQYVELHGTGTRAGDRTEAAALGAALGAAKADGDAVRVGSVKTNIGHLEGAAGIAGLIKAALCLDRRELVPSLNFREPSPEIPLDELRLRVQEVAGPWPEPDRPLVAGVTSVGIGGTNCHVVLAEAAATGAQPSRIPAGQVVPWVLSAKSAPALQAQARRLSAWLDERPDADLGHVGHTLAGGRATFRHRAVALGADRAELAGALAALAARAPAANVVTGRAIAGGGGTVFVFPGQGAQWEGMGVELLDGCPAFAGALRACDAALAPFTGWSVVDVLRGAAGAPRLEGAAVIQPALFAVTVALAETWGSLGVRPAAVIGHSQGEIAAAHVAGALSLDDAARIVALRAQVLSERLAGRGAMAALPLSRSQATQYLGAELSLAAVNGPSSVVVSGAPGPVEALLATCEAQRIEARRLPVDYASHSQQVEAIREPLLAAISGIAARPAPVRIYSSAFGRPLAPDDIDAEYWYRGLREPVEFERAVRSALRDGARTFIEVSPHPVLAAGIEDTARHAGDVAVVASLRRGEGGPRRLLTALAELYVRGEAVDWTARFAAFAPRRVRLPAYPFERRTDAAGPADAPDGGMLAAVRAQVAVVLGHSSSEEVDPELTFKELGFDSMGLMELHDRLADLADARLPITLLFDHPTPASVAEALA